MKIDYTQGFSDFQIDRDEPVFTTGVVTRLVNIPLWVLKQLDNEGVVSPSREARKARLYSTRELNRVRKVWHLMETRKVTINGIKVIIEMHTEFFEEA